MHFFFILNSWHTQKFDYKCVFVPSLFFLKSNMVTLEKNTILDNDNTDLTSFGIPKLAVGIAKFLPYNSQHKPTRF